MNGPAPSPLLQQGSALLAGGRFHEALAAFGQALREAPDGYDARLGLARACAGAGDPLAAAAWLNDAARIQPASPEPLHLLAELLLGLKLYAQALPVYRRLFDGHGARDQATVLHLAYSLEQVGALDEAALRYREALAAWPDFLEAHVDLAGMLWRIGDFAGAMAHAQRSVELAPQHPHALRILGTAHLNLGRVEEAEALFRRALELKPGFPLAELDLAFTLLGAGRLREGWQWYARRWNDVDRLRRPPFWQPPLEWQGPQAQPPRGRRLLVYAEQGLGDVIQFCRYVPLLQRAGATVLGVVQPELVALLEHSFPGFTCLTADRHLQADAHVALLDLPLHLGTDTLADIPAPEAYLQAPRDKVAAWGERLRPWAGKLKVGLAWCGFQGQMNNRNRAMALGDCLPLLTLPGVQCFSVQKSDAGAWTDIVPPAGSLVDFTADWQDFTDSAAMLQHLDLVVTVDTSLAHLSGALGRPTWVLLAPNADWRWLHGREDSPWYPSMRLFRRGLEETRGEVVARVVRALQGIAALH